MTYFSEFETVIVLFDFLLAFSYVLLSVKLGVSISREIDRLIVAMWNRFP